jgi:AraC-like DNA-binding protein
MRVYLHGSISSLASMKSAAYVKVKRPDVLVALSVSPDHPATINTKDFSGQSAVTVIAPQTDLQGPAPEQGLVLMCFHLIHPLYPRLRALADKTKALPPEKFAHLLPALRLARLGMLDVAAAADLMDGVAAAMLEGIAPPPPIDPRVLSAMRLLDENIHLPFEQIIGMLGLSASRLSHLFSEHMGLSFRSYVSWGRVMQAWVLAMLHPEMSLTEIALKKGYADSSHLSRAFKTCFGLTPSKMRNRGIVDLVGHPMPDGRNIPPEIEFARTAQSPFLRND